MHKHPGILVSGVWCCIFQVTSFQIHLPVRLKVPDRCPSYCTTISSFMKEGDQFKPPPPPIDGG